MERELTSDSHSDHSAKSRHDHPPGILLKLPLNLTSALSDFPIEYRVKEHCSVDLGIMQFSCPVGDNELHVLETEESIHGTEPGNQIIFVSIRRPEA
jgi:hypothetical protein